MIIVHPKTKGGYSMCICKYIQHKNNHLSVKVEKGILPKKLPSPKEKVNDVFCSLFCVLKHVVVAGYGCAYRYRCVYNGQKQVLSFFS